MKALFFLLCLLVSSGIFAQEAALFVTDSLIKVNKVKTRTKRYTPGEMGYVVEHFDSAGKLTHSEFLNAEDDLPLTITYYYYDGSGKCTASTIVDQYYRSYRFLLNAYHEYVKSMTSFYEYDKNNKLMRTYIKDSLNRVNYECLYSYDPSITKKIWYNREHQMTQEATEHFEAGKFATKLEFKNYDSTATVPVDRVEEYDNRYNEKGQLIETKYHGKKGCTATRKYKYYKNGLMKSKTKDKCQTNWKFTYKYY